MKQLSWRTARVSGCAVLTAAALVGPAAFSSPSVPRQTSSQEVPALFTQSGELLPPEAIGETIVEGWDEVLARDARAPRTGYDLRTRGGAQGEWMIASRKRHGIARSGEHYVTNKWGDARMGIGFGRIVDVSGAWFIGQDDVSKWPASIVVVGYRAGVETGRTPAFTSFSDQPTWFDMGLLGVDRIEIRGEALTGRACMYGLDDLSFAAEGASVVVDFEQKNYQEKLTGTGYAGLEWEVGTGDFDREAVHAPLSKETGLGQREDDHETFGGGGTAPVLVSSFQGPATNNGTSGAVWVPPDTCGAVGVNHFVTVVNSNISIYEKATGARVLNSDLDSFLAGDSWGDPRVTFDKVSQKFIVLAADFNNEISVAISNTSDPTGAWTKAAFNPGTGADAGKWADYPTLGVNKDFIVTCAYMVGGSSLMSIFAIDKQNFINTGTLTITAFRNVPWEGAIHGATTWDDTASQYLVSRVTGSGLRIRRLNLPASAPTLSELGIASTSVGAGPPDASQQGGFDLDTLDGRLMNAVWANGSLWTTNCISSGGRAGCRWYEVDTNSITVTQAATLDDASLHYFMPSIAVNGAEDVVLGFSGSNASQFAGAYFTGRVASDAPDQMGIPVQYKPGESTNGDGRWGDYSLTSVDPTDESTFWTAQEYAESNGSWGVYVAEVQHAGSLCDLHNYCVTSPNSVGAGSLISYAGSASVAANDFSVLASGNPANQNGIFFMGTSEASTSFGNGVLCVSGAFTRYRVVQTDAFGSVSFYVDNTIPPAAGKIVAGSTWKWQFWYRDPADGGAFFNLSDGLSATYCP